METTQYRKEVCTSTLKFKSGWTSVNHKEGAGRSLTSTTKENNEQAQQMILADRSITIDEQAHSLQISRGSAYQIIHDNLRFQKVSARWLPKELTIEH